MTRCHKQNAARQKSVILTDLKSVGDIYPSRCTLERDRICGFQKKKKPSRCLQGTLRLVTEAVPSSEQSKRLFPLEPKVITKATRFGAMSLAGSRHCERRIGLRSDGRKSGRKASVQNAQPALLRGSAFPLH